MPPYWVYRDGIGRSGDREGSVEVGSPRSGSIDPALAFDPLLPAVPDASRTRELLEVLDVRRNAAIGFGAGVAVAVLAYAFRVGELAGPTADTRGSPALFLVLAFVLAVTVGLVATAALTVRSALRVARKAEGEPPSVER